MFEGIFKLQPGHVLTVDPDGQVETSAYWTPTSGGVDLGDASEQEIATLVRDGLRKSIDLRMMSDVPFGVFLSGGVDSSLNVAMMSEMMDRPVDTFSVSLQGDPESDESEHARRVAKHFGTRHHEVEVTSQQFVEFLPQMVRHQDEPLADPVCVPLYFVSKLAKDSGTTVVQVGEGADELFAGYNGYGVMSDFHRRLFGPFARLPAPVKRLAALAAPKLMPERRAEYIRRAAANEELFWGGAVVFSGRHKRRLVRNGGGDRSYRDVIAGYYAEYDRAKPGMSFLDRIINVELRHRLPELLLMRVDKMSMAASVEARVPFLDHKLVELALSIPSPLKYKNGRTKHILKEAAAPLLPPGVIDRPKKGFCGGTTNMIGPAVAAYAAKVIRSSEFLASRLHMPYVNELVGQHVSGKANRGAEVWSLMNLALWHDVWIEGQQR
jgi:asparagine synthase (glutamine-hydrolysing)